VNVPATNLRPASEPPRVLELDEQLVGFELPTVVQRRSFSMNGQENVDVLGEVDDLDLKPGAPVKKLELAGGKAYSGNPVGQFVNADLFTFQDLTDVAPAK
jgi:hypothetical protein